jgi:predicted ATPase
MASAWGLSFGNAWGNSWGATQIVVKCGGSSKKKRGWANERAQFELSHEVIKAKQVFEESTDETIQAIVEKIDDYTHEREQFEALQIEFALLQSRLYNDSSYSADLRQAALTLQEFIQDEQDAIDLLMLMEDFDARCVITATTQPFKVVS